jgi:ribonucleoside-diphosphate reductase beta chain
MHWVPEEIPLHADIKCWNNKLTPEERNLLTQIFRFFTQADIDVASGYIDRYMPMFHHPELRTMMGSFTNMEGIHIEAYSLLIDTVGMPESEYLAFTKYKEMADKHQYINQEAFDIPSQETIYGCGDVFETDEEKAVWIERMEHEFTYRVALNIAVYSAFTEGLQLFSSFAILLNFQRFKKMTGMCKIVEFSVKDESLHVDNMISVFRTIIEENQWLMTPDFANTLTDIGKDMVDLEDAFIDLAFEQGGSKDLDKEDVKKYIRFVCNHRLVQLGLQPVYDVTTNPLPWLDEIVGAVSHTNFFEARSADYAKANYTGTWADIWAKSPPKPT